MAARWTRSNLFIHECPFHVAISNRILWILSSILSSRLRFPLQVFRGIFPLLTCLITLALACTGAWVKVPDYIALIPYPDYNSVWISCWCIFWKLWHEYLLLFFSFFFCIACKHVPISLWTYICPKINNKNNIITSANSTLWHSTYYLSSLNNPKYSNCNNSLLCDTLSVAVHSSISPS